MTKLTTTLSVGAAGCAVALAAFVTVTPAEAAPVSAPAAPQLPLPQQGFFDPFVGFFQVGFTQVGQTQFPVIFPPTPFWNQINQGQVNFFNTLLGPGNFFSLFVPVSPYF